jgi:long-subunit acyl-CoA synthetase (AMP-forming)
MSLAATPYDIAARPRAFRSSTLCEAFQITAAEHAAHPALRLKGSDFECTWAEYAAIVRRRAAGLAALGVSRGDTIGFMLVNRPAFHLCDAAAMHLGAACWSIYNTSSPGQIEYMLRNAASRVLVTEQAFLGRLLEVRARVPGIEHVIVVDGEAPAGTLSLDALEAAGAPGFDFDAAWRAVRPEDVLCLIYSSGTTGQPKGVELTHFNMMSQLRAFDRVYPVTPGGRSISFLPSAHVADRWASHYSSMVYGHTLYCLPDARELFAYSAQVRPTVWGGVPRIWEKLKTALEKNLSAETDPGRRTAMAEALATGIERARAKREGRVPAELEAKWREADARLFSPLRSLLGLDKVEAFAVGAAPMSPDVLLFFDAIGIEIAEMWGLTECTSNGAINPPGAIKPGTVGKPLPGMEARIMEDGEILMRGPMIMKGYRGDPKQTAEAIDADGWLHTGDLGAIDEDGYLRIIGRKKDIIINASGKNMSPIAIEAAIKSESPLIGHAIAIGDARPYNVALIVLDPEGAAGVDPAAPETLRLVGEAIERANARLSRVEQIKRFRILPGDWPPGGDELTPTHKLKRKPISEKYAREIEEIYAGPGN